MASSKFGSFWNDNTSLLDEIEAIKDTTTSSLTSASVLTDTTTTSTAASVTGHAISPADFTGTISVSSGIIGPSRVWSSSGSATTTTTGIMHGENIRGLKVIDYNHMTNQYTTEDGTIWEKPMPSMSNPLGDYEEVGSTPEKKVKDQIKKRLTEAGAYYYMPVSNGMGAAQLDFICHIKPDGKRQAISFYIEAKASGKKPTERQEATIDTLRTSGAAVFVIDGTEDTDMDKLDLWLLAHQNTG